MVWAGPTAISPPLMRAEVEARLPEGDTTGLSVRGRSLMLAPQAPVIAGGVSVCLLASINLKLLVGRRAAVADWRLG
jgi:hypothetical protein